MGKNTDGNLHTLISKHLDISKNKLLNENVQEESRQLVQYLIELVGFRSNYKKLKRSVAS